MTEVHYPMNDSFYSNIIDRINMGIVVVDRTLTIHCWNGFMTAYSGIKAENLIGENLLDSFPDLPKSWLQKKINGVFLFENYAFSSWKNRPFLFSFRHNRPVTSNIDFMRQNCTFFPIRNDANEVEYVCIAITDATDDCVNASQLSKAMTSLETLSRVDGLTGISNRSHFENRLIEEFMRAQRYKSNLSFMLMDLDHFKKVNDTYGHLAGDEVLRVVAEKIAKEIRSVDFVGRYGGEEFAVFLPQTTTDGAISVAERIRQSIASEPVQFEEKSISITISVGVAQYKKTHKNHEVLISEADRALYRSKANGRNKVTLYSQETCNP